MPFGPRIIGQCLEPRVADALFFRIVSYVAMNIIGDKYFGSSGFSVGNPCQELAG
ncbi:hypothetical protein [Desulfovibrio sp. G11]|uniref:hypothetical protein n=1 Tax=Desulfovibrio sp. G11 TaxID=631220 RepID=UPI0012FE2A0C|nr:hypothetical protein [Desulfovibrio sp. G11]